MAKILVVLYPDPVDGYPPAYARSEIPVISEYPGGQTVPTPSAIDFTPRAAPGFGVRGTRPPFLPGEDR